MWQRLGVLRYFLALMEAQRAPGAAPGAANVRFRVGGIELCAGVGVSMSYGCNIMLLTI